MMMTDVNAEIYRLCFANTLSEEKAKGKIVFCLRGNNTRIGKGMEVKRAGGVGYILGNTMADGQAVTADPHVLPATAVGAIEAVQILKYINSTTNPKAKIIPAETLVRTSPAPFMASFTSRGPNVIDPTILKVYISKTGLLIEMFSQIQLSKFWSAFCLWVVA